MLRSKTPSVLISTGIQLTRLFCDETGTAGPGKCTAAPSQQQPKVTRRNEFTANTGNVALIPAETTNPQKNHLLARLVATSELKF